MKYKKIAEIVIIVYILLMSLTIFPWLGTAFGWGGIGLSSFIITCVFASVWLIVLFFAVGMKSKALINTYLCYWLAVTGVCTFVIAFAYSTVLGMFRDYLFLIFLTPIGGIYYLFSNLWSSNLWSAIILFIPVCMFLLGLFVKLKFIKCRHQ